jgi:xanthine dehydrogenase accessory factor
MGAMLGYHVVVVDDRQEFLTRKRFPDPRIDLLPHEIEGAAAAAGINSRTAVVIVTRGHQSDEACLKSVLRSRAIYIGMIGSRRRVLGVFKKLSNEGFGREEFSRVHAPIGLKIGARTPQEIAIAILAEIIDWMNNPKPEQRGAADGV